MSVVGTDGMVQKNQERNDVIGCTLVNCFNQVDGAAGSFVQGQFVLFIKSF